MSGGGGLKKSQTWGEGRGGGTYGVLLRGTCLEGSGVATWSRDSLIITGASAFSWEKGMNGPPHLARVDREDDEDRNLREDNEHAAVDEVEDEHVDDAFHRRPLYYII